MCEFDHIFDAEEDQDSEILLDAESDQIWEESFDEDEEWDVLDEQFEELAENWAAKFILNRFPLMCLCRACCTEKKNAFNFSVLQFLKIQI